MIILLHHKITEENLELAVAGRGSKGNQVSRHQWVRQAHQKRYAWHLHLHLPSFLLLLIDLSDSFSDVLLSLQVNYLQPHLVTHDPEGGRVTYVHISLIFPPVLSGPPGSWRRGQRYWLWPKLSGWPEAPGVPHPLPAAIPTCVSVPYWGLTGQPGT